MRKGPTMTDEQLKAKYGDDWEFWKPFEEAREADEREWRAEHERRWQELYRSKFPT